MCFGPSKAEKATAAASQQEQADAALAQRVSADSAAQAEAEARAKKKQEDIGAALDSKTAREGMAGGGGRRSLFSSGAQGFLGRFQ
jgi:hypothetical protein